jgi:hypothetical protein
MSRKIVGYLLLTSIIGACGDGKSRTGSEGHLEVAWQGKEPGRISGKADAGWCSLRQVLEIQTVQGDTGIALALYPGKSLVPGAYRVLDPGKAESLPPAAGVAVRWLGKSVIQGFQGDSGRVDLERSGSGLLSGRVQAHAHSVVDTQRIVLTGTFRDVAVRPDSLGCAPPEPADEDADPADTGVH